MMLNGQEVPWTVSNQAQAFVQNTREMLGGMADQSKALGNAAMHPIATAAMWRITLNKFTMIPIGYAWRSNRLKSTRSGRSLGKRRRRRSGWRSCWSCSF